DDLSGQSDKDSGYNTQKQIGDYQNKHYVLTSDETNGRNVVFDHNDNDQTYHVYFVHGTHTINQTTSPKQTIHYVYADGLAHQGKAADDNVQQLSFKRDGYNDEVTGVDHWNDWTPANSQYKAVDSPVIQGYTPDKLVVEKSTVNPTDKDIEITVTYNADKQAAHVIYVDKTTNTTLASDDLSGQSDKDSGYNTQKQIGDYQNKHYVLTSDETNGKNVVFDHNDNDQTYHVYFVHGTQDVNHQDDVTETVDYKFENGETAQPTVTQTKHFSEGGVKDLVTGKIAWDEAKPQKFDHVTTPAISGYTPDKDKVAGSTVKFGDKDIEVTVTYHNNAQKAVITYVDDVTNKTLASDSQDGKFDYEIIFEHDPAEVIKGLEEKGYKLVSNDFNNNKYQADNSNNVFYVHFVHDTKKVSQEHSASFTVHYIYKDGKQAKPDHEQTISFTENGVKDKVTGKIAWDEAKPQKFDDVTTPVITGYTPDQAKVAGQTANFDTQDRKVTVTYSPDIQLGRINYIDDNTGKTLTHDDFSGRTNEHEDYTPIDRIQEFENKGYELVSNDYPDGGFNFDDNDQQDQVFNVHLKHGTTTVTPDNPGRPGEPVDPDNPDGPKYPDGTDKTGLTDTVNRTITYVMIDGSKAPDAVHDSLSYTASKVIDKVNGEVLETKWSANQDFKDVDSPSVKGYTPDKKTVSNKNVAHDAADITETVKYSADAQKASVTYVDDKTGKTLKVDNLNGVTNAKSGYTTKAAIETYTGLGYTLVSDDTNGSEVVFDNDDAVDQAFTVHLSHGTITVTPENPGKPGEPVDPDNPDGPKYPDGTDEYQVKRTGTQTIHYVGANDKTPADNNQTFIFTREITFDNVTGNIISVTPWNVQSHTFGNVDTPVIPGYHADKAVAGGATVTPDDLNRVITVTYAPDGNPGNPGDQGDTPTPEPTPEPDPTPNPTPDDQPDSEISSDEHFENVKAKDKLDKTNPKKMDAYKKERKIIKTKIAKQDHTEIAEPKLPQTGEADNSIIGLLGMLLASFAAMFGFDSLHSHDKKHKN
ncbi:mucin-binding protein, partial [Lactobacillus johnsonii]|uniref:mucin-binding protein n=1 Tax=Lactobacillus johnsonii TaxID=33959 RepID=UPI00254B2C18